MQPEKALTMLPLATRQACTLAILSFIIFTVVTSLHIPLTEPHDVPKLDRREPDGAAHYRLNSRAAPTFYARILPLGASIVYGMGSSTGNG